MRKFWIIISVCWLWTCGGGGGSPTEPNIELPTVQNIEFNLEEDTSKTFAFMGSDPLNRALTYSVSTQPQHGTLTINAGAGTYTPNANYHGADTFAYIATNVDGTSNIGTIIATITPVDDEPNSMDVSATTDEDNAIDITLEAEEVDGDNIIFQVRNNPSNGSVSISGTTATYIPNQDWNGTDTFNFEAVDSSEKTVLNVATATIIVNPVNDAPVMENQSFNYDIFFNEIVSVPLNSTDIDGDNITYVVNNHPSGGTLSIESLTFDPDYDGIHSFTVQAYDGQEYSQEVTININLGFKLLTYNGDDPSNMNRFYDVILSSSDDILAAGVRNGNPSLSVIDHIDGTQIIFNTLTAEGTVMMAIDRLHEGGFVLAGSTGLRSGVPHVIKVDDTGNEVWSKKFDSFTGWSDQHFYSIVQTNDGGYLAGGRGFNGGAGWYGKFLIKLDSSGNIVWQQEGQWNDDPEILSNHRPAYRSIISSEDGSLFVGASGGTIYKLDQNGSKQWVVSNIGYNIFSYENDDIYRLDFSGDNTIIALGNSRWAYVSKLDYEGNQLWIQSLDDSFLENWIDGEIMNTNFKSVKTTSDLGIIVIGRVNKMGVFTNDVNRQVAIKLDSEGSVVWVYEGAQDIWFYDIDETSNGDLIVVGANVYYWRWEDNVGRVRVIKLNSQGRRIF